MGLLAVILCGTICVQVITPLVASRFIDQATSGGDLRDLIVLALLTMGLALAGQGLAVVETYVAENVSWAATNALRADLVAHLLRLDAAFHTAYTPGELIERVGEVGSQRGTVVSLDLPQVAVMVFWRYHRTALFQLPLPKPDRRVSPHPAFQGGGSTCIGL